MPSHGEPSARRALLGRLAGRGGLSDLGAGEDHREVVLRPGSLPTRLKDVHLGIVGRLADARAKRAPGGRAFIATAHAR